MDAISIVIPTQKRFPSLSRTLAEVASQDLEGLDVELVVVCSDASRQYRERVLGLATSLPLTAKVLARAEGGAAGARNAGVDAASGELILFLNEDTPPASTDLVRSHAQIHAERSDESLGVLGRCAWDPGVARTPVMDWLTRTGKMNDYRGLEDGGVERPMLYAPNLSLHRTVISRVGGFDERFWRYGWAEYDLAMRLSDQGFQIDFRPKLVCWHDHRYTLRDSLRRMDAVGRGANLINRVHGSREGLVTPVPTGAKGRAGRALAPAARFVPVPRWLPERFRDQAFRLLHYAVLARGYGRSPIPEGTGMKGGIRARDELATPK